MMSRVRQLVPRQPIGRLLNGANGGNVAEAGEKSNDRACAVV